MTDQPNPNALRRMSNPHIHSIERTRSSIVGCRIHIFTALRERVRRCKIALPGRCASALNRRLLDHDNVGRIPRMSADLVNMFARTQLVGCRDTSTECDFCTTRSKRDMMIVVHFSTKGVIGVKGVIPKRNATRTELIWVDQ
jgi:hypothetical protein